MTMIEECEENGNPSILQDTSSRMRSAACNMIADEMKDDTDSRQEELTRDREDNRAGNIVRILMNI